MDIAGVRDVLHRQPPQPFTIRLADGRSRRVLHPDFVAVGKRHIVVIAEDDTTSIVEPLLIASLDTLPKKGKGSNGKQRSA